MNIKITFVRTCFYLLLVIFTEMAPAQQQYPYTITEVESYTIPEGRIIWGHPQSGGIREPRFVLAIVDFPKFSVKVGYRYISSKNVLYDVQSGAIVNQSLMDDIFVDSYGDYYLVKDISDTSAYEDDPPWYATIYNGNHEQVYREEYHPGYETRDNYSYTLLGQQESFLRYDGTQYECFQMDGAKRWSLVVDDIAPPGEEKTQSPVSDHWYYRYHKISSPQDSYLFFVFRKGIVTLSIDGQVLWEKNGAFDGRGLTCSPDEKYLLLPKRDERGILICDPATGAVAGVDSNDWLPDDDEIQWLITPTRYVTRGIVHSLPDATQDINFLRWTSSLWQGEIGEPGMEDGQWRIIGWDSQVAGEALWWIGSGKYEEFYRIDETTSELEVRNQQLVFTILDTNRTVLARHQYQPYKPPGYEGGGGVGMADLMVSRDGRTIQILLSGFAIQRDDVDIIKRFRVEER